MKTSTLAKDFDLQQWSGYSRTLCEREFKRAHNCTRIWSFRQLREKSHNSNNMSVETQQTPHSLTEVIILVLLTTLNRGYGT